MYLKLTACYRSAGVLRRSERDLAEAKLRAFKSLDAPVAPSGKGFSLFWSRLDDDVRQTFRTRVLAVRP